MIQVFLPSQVDDYTGGLRELTIDPRAIGEHPTLLDVIDELERRYRGIAFRLIDEQRRIRRHIAVFVGEEMLRDPARPLPADARVQIVGALSGG